MVDVCGQICCLPAEVARLFAWYGEVEGELGDPVLHLEDALQQASTFAIKLTDKYLGDRAGVELTKALASNNVLSVLQLNGCGLGDLFAAQLEQLLMSNVALKVLDLDLNMISSVGLAGICQGLTANRALRELDLNRNEIGSEGAQHLAGALTLNATLCKLSLHGNSIGDDGALSLAQALPQNAALQHLVLERNNITDRGAAHLASGVAKNFTMRTLSLGSNSIADVGAVALARMLSENGVLQEFHLDDNLVADEGAEAIAGALEQNRGLTELWLVDNLFSPRVARSFATALMRNGALRRLGLSSDKRGDAGAIRMLEAAGRWRRARADTASAVRALPAAELATVLPSRTPVFAPLGAPRPRGARRGSRSPSAGSRRRGSPGRGSRGASPRGAAGAGSPCPDALAAPPAARGALLGGWPARLLAGGAPGTPRGPRAGRARSTPARQSSPPSSTASPQRASASGDGDEAVPAEPPPNVPRGSPSGRGQPPLAVGPRLDPEGLALSLPQGDGGAGAAEAEETAWQFPREFSGLPDGGIGAPPAARDHVSDLASPVPRDAPPAPRAGARGGGRGGAARGGAPAVRPVRLTVGGLPHLQDVSEGIQVQPSLMPRAAAAMLDSVGQATPRGSASPLAAPPARAAGTAAAPGGGDEEPLPSVAQSGPRGPAAGALSARRAAAALRVQVVQRGVPLALTVVRARGRGGGAPATCRFWVRGRNPDAKFQTPPAVEVGACADLVWAFQQKVPGAEEGDVVEFEILGGRPGSTEQAPTCRGVLVLVRAHLSAGGAELEVPLAEVPGGGPAGSLQVRVRELVAGGAQPSPRETLRWSPRGWSPAPRPSPRLAAPTLSEAGDDEPTAFH